MQITAFAQYQLDEFTIPRTMTLDLLVCTLPEVHHSSA